MTVNVAEKNVLDAFAKSAPNPAVVTIARPVAGAPKKIIVNSKNASELADAFGDLKRRIKELEETETKYRDAFVLYGRRRRDAAIEAAKNNDAVYIKTNLLVVGVVYKVDINLDIDAERFEQKRFTDENPGLVKYYTVPNVYDKVDVRAVK